MSRTVVAAFLLAVALGMPSSARACSCAAPATAQEALNQASAAFSGQVAQISQPLLDRLGLTDKGSHDVTFRIFRVWKGEAGAELVIRTRLSGEACGYPFVFGGSYLVFVREEIPGIETGICTGTRDLLGADEEVRALDAATQ